MVLKKVYNLKGLDIDKEEGKNHDNNVYTADLCNTLRLLCNNVTNENYQKNRK